MTAKEWSRRYPKTRFRRRGFCIHAAVALRDIAHGTVHFIEGPRHQMATCGYNRASHPSKCKRVKRAAITCLRCLTVVLLRLSREGKLEAGR